MKVHLFSVKLTSLLFIIVSIYRYTFLPMNHKFLNTVTEIYSRSLFDPRFHYFLDFIIRRELGAFEISNEVWVEVEVTGCQIG